MGCCCRSLACVDVPKQHKAQATQPIQKNCLSNASQPRNCARQVKRAARTDASACAAPGVNTPAPAVRHTFTPPPKSWSSHRHQHICRIGSTTTPAHMCRMSQETPQKTAELVGSRLCLEAAMSCPQIPGAAGLPGSTHHTVWRPYCES